MQTTSPPRLLVIDSEKKFLQKLTDFLTQKNFIYHTATTASKAAAMLHDNPYRIVITDFFLPDESVNLLEMVRKHRPEALIIILTGFGTFDSAVIAIREGCFDYLRKPIKIDQLVEVIKRAEEKIEKSKNRRKEMAWGGADGWPGGFHNAGAFREKAKEEFYRANRYKTNLSLIIADLDNCEIAGSSFGLDPEDFLLKKIIPHIKKQVRVSDFVSPYNEDKIGIILPETGRAGTVEIARKLIRMFSETEFQVGERCANIPMSLGIVSYPEDPVLTYTQLISFAEQALDTIKRKGKNQIGFYGLDVSPSADLWEGNDTKNDKMAKLVESKRGLWRKLKRIYVESIYSLAKALQTGDDYHKTHSANVSRYGEDLARMLELDNWTVERIKYAGILHDIGKIGVSETILQKPDRLTGAEFDEIKRHCEIGVKIIRDAHFLQEEIPIILHHHEWFDGSGYPCGLRGEDIPIGARILGMVDTFDSLTNERCYRRGYAPKEAMEEIKKYSGLQFDPELVNCMEEYILATER
jgi:diguanylate cyclase (GGDEF)-like protein/putative nucleotidyltransferase with HDIG domain